MIKDIEDTEKWMAEWGEGKLLLVMINRVVMGNVLKR